jgi:Na+-transporting NADH:ubiquinone oxidoreductase subunit F
MFVLLSIIVFSAVILGLSYMLIYARKKLVPQGDVKIIVNGDEENPILAKPGSSLLSTLGDRSIFLPSACGGGGTCAMCECHVYEGGGDVLPTEMNHLTRKEAAEGMRLACQVKVRQDMKIGIPEEIFGIKKWECEVISNYNVATFIKEFIVKLPEGEHLDFQAGGYIQIDVPPVTVDYKGIDITAHPKYHDRPDKFQKDWDQNKMWGLKMVNDEPIFRAYSMSNHPAEGNIVSLTIRIATPPFKFKMGSDGKRQWGRLRSSKSGYLFFIYLFKKTWRQSDDFRPIWRIFHKTNTSRNAVCRRWSRYGTDEITLVYHLFQTLKTGRKVTFFYGGRTKQELFYIEEFREIEKQFPNFRFAVALDNPLPEDNWTLKNAFG